MKLLTFLALTIFSSSGHAMLCDLKSHPDLGNQILKELEAKLSSPLF